MSSQRFRESLMDWFAEHGRHDLPWQHPRTPYRVWLSEIMLQQTQVQTVIPYFERFMKRFPTLESLASAEMDEVLLYWAGLGYYARGRNVHKAARYLYFELNGVWPTTLTGLQALPGIGYSTAAAILSQAFGLPYAVLDANVKRVLARYFGVAGAPQDKNTLNTLLEYANDCLDIKQPCDYTQAIMDLGATCCTAKKPQCMRCPVRSNCIACKENAVMKYPAPKTKKTKPTMKRFFYCILDQTQNSILLQRRPESGIWGGLWCLPEETQSLEKFCKHPDLYCKLQSLKHSFSHYNLILEPELLCTSQQSFEHHFVEARWFRLDALNQLGLPKPIVTILRQHLLNTLPDYCETD